MQGELHVQMSEIHKAQNKKSHTHANHVENKATS